MAVAKRAIGLTSHGIRLAAPFPEIDGEAEFVRLVHKHGWSVLATTEFADIPAMTLRPLTGPVPLSPVRLAWRRGLTHPGLRALRTAARELAREHDWLHHPEGAWLPGADRLLRVRRARSKRLRVGNE